jgi:hypothetical protein
MRRREVWRIGYSHPVGTRNERWLDALLAGRAYGFLDARSGRVTMPPTVPVGDAREVPVGPSGSVIAVAEPSGIVAVLLDGAGEAVFGKMTGGALAGVRVRLRPSAGPHPLFEKEDGDAGRR